MKKCMNCGNLGDESSTTCEVCGSQLQTVPEAASGVEETAAPAEQAQENKAPEKPAAPVSGAQDPARRPRRTKSGPQIYGQGEGMPNAAYGQQGMIRRDVQGRGTNGQRPANGAPTERPMRQSGGAPAERPVRQPNGAPAERPMRQPNGAPAERPMNMQGGAPTERPVRQPNGAPAERPMNMQGGVPTERPMRQPGGAPAGHPMNMQGRPGGNASMVHPGKRMEAARAALKSPLLILIALLNTVCLAGAVAAIFMDQMNYSQFIRLISDISMPAQLSGYVDSLKTILNKLDSGMIAANLVLHIPDMLLCLGLWLVCITARTAKEKMSGIGFLFMKLNVLINMLVTCVIVLAALILSVTLAVSAWVAGMNSMIVIAAVLLVVMVITAMCSIMYYFCYLATIKVCRLNAGTGEPYGKASAYVAFVHVIVGLSGIIGLLSGIVNSEISNIAGSVGKIGWMILFAVWILSYRSKMSEFED